MPAFIDLNLNQALQALRLKQLGSVAAVKQAMTSAWQKRVIVRDVATGAVVRTQESVNSLSKAESLVPASAAHHHLLLLLLPLPLHRQSRVQPRRQSQVPPPKRVKLTLPLPRRL